MSNIPNKAASHLHRNTSVRLAKGCLRRVRCLVGLIRWESNIRPIVQLLMQQAPVMLLLLHAAKAFALPEKTLSRQCVVTRRRLNELSQ